MPTYGGRRGLAQPFIAAMAAQGYKPTEALAALREQNLGYRMTDFFHDYALMLGQEVAKDSGKFTAKDKYPGAASTAPTEWSLKERFQMVFNVDVYSKATGEFLERRYVSMDLDSPVIVGVGEGMMAAALEDSVLGGLYPSDVEFANVTYAFMRERSS